MEYVSRFRVENSNKINYKDLIEDVQNFDYMIEQSQPRSAATQKSGLTDAIAHNEPKGIFDDDYIVLDQRKVP